MLRTTARIIALLSIALLVAACGGPDDPTASLAEACERQIEQAHADEGGTPTAKSTTERLEATTLVECAGQRTRIVAADAEDGDAAAGEGDAEGEGAEGEGGEAVEVDPAVREAFATTCGGCHTLSDAETTGAVGPNLDETTLDAAGVEEIIANGSGAMPPGLLEGEEATSVAEYVAGAAAAG